MNSDIFIDVDIPLFIESSGNDDSIAHLILTEQNNGGVYAHLNRYGKFIVSDIIGEGKGGDFLFTGIHIVKKEIIKYLPSEGYPICIVRNGYIPALRNGEKISAYLHKGFFFDIGTPQRLSELKNLVNKEQKVANILKKVKELFIF